MGGGNLTDENRKLVLSIADHICLLDDESKIFVAGYIFGAIFNEEKREVIFQDLIRRRNVNESYKID